MTNKIDKVLSNDKLQDAINVHNTFWAFHRDRLILQNVGIDAFRAKQGESMVLAIVRQCRFDLVTMPGTMNCSAFIESEFKQCYFGETDAPNTHFTRCIFTDCSFRITNFKNATFTECKFIRCTFDQTRLVHASFLNCTFESSVMREVRDFHTDYRTCTFDKTRVSLISQTTLQAILRCVDAPEEYYGGWCMLIQILPMVLDYNGGAALYDICNDTPSPILSVVRHYLMAHGVMSSHVLTLERMLAMAIGKVTIDCPKFLREYCQKSDGKEEQQ